MFTEIIWLAAIDYASELIKVDHSCIIESHVINIHDILTVFTEFNSKFPKLVVLKVVFVADNTIFKPILTLS